MFRPRVRWRGVMNRWICALAVVVAAFGVGAVAEQQPSQPAAGGQKSGGHEHGKLDPAEEKCMKACVDCARECEACFDHCVMLTAQGKKEHVRTLKTCVDCGDICALAAKAIGRNGALAPQICDGCAKACDACGAECEKHDDPMMKRCAEACKACAKACREMIQHAGHHDHGGKK